MILDTVFEEVSSLSWCISFLNIVMHFLDTVSELYINIVYYHTDLYCLWVVSYPSNLQLLKPMDIVTHMRNMKENE